MRCVLLKKFEVKFANMVALSMLFFFPLLDFCIALGIFQTLLLCMYLVMIRFYELSRCPGYHPGVPGMRMK